MDSKRRLLNAKLTRISRSTDRLASAESSLNSMQSKLRAVRAQVASIRDLAKAQIDSPNGDTAGRQAQLDALLTAINGEQDSTLQGGRPFLGRRNQQAAALNVNSSQVSNVQINAPLGAETVTLEGSLVREAEFAEIELLGASGAIKSTADFDLTGSLGTRSFSVTRGESLADVRQRINLESANTGVAASVQNDRLVFRSTSKGAAQQVDVDLTNLVTSTDITGLNSQQVTSLDTSQLDVNQTLNVSGQVVSLAAKAQLVYSGDGSGRLTDNDVITITGNLGTETINVKNNRSINQAVNRINNVQGSTGVTARREGNQIFIESALEGADQIVEISSQNGSFEGAGGNGDGTANGVDYVAEINGSNITANGSDQFVLQTGAGDVTLEFESSFVGVFDTFQIDKQARFELQGGNGSGEDSGVDAEAIVNGQTLNSISNQFVYSDDYANASITFQDGAIGAFDSITLDRDGGRQSRSPRVAIALPSSSRQKNLYLESLSLDIDDLEGSQFSLNDLANGGTADLATDAQDAFDTATAVLAILDNHDLEIETARTNVIEKARTSITNRTSNLQSKIAAIDTAEQARQVAEKAKADLRDASIASLFDFLSNPTTRSNAISLLT